MGEKVRGEMRANAMIKHNTREMANRHPGSGWYIVNTQFAVEFSFIEGNPNRIKAGLISGGG